MKLVFITDTHGMASNPGSRLDSFPEAILKKMDYVVAYAKQIGAEAILHGGDWLHTPDVSESFIREFCNILRNSEVPIYGILGNHDIYGYNPETFKRTALGVGEVMGAFTRLYIDKPIYLEDSDVTVRLTGRDSYADLDKGTGWDKIKDYAPDMPEGERTDCVHVHIVHGMLVEREWSQVACTTIDELTNVGAAHITLTGHEHTGFGVIKRGKNIFCNPGSLARVTAGTGDVRKDVRMAVITVNSVDDYDIELVNLPCEVARPSSEVLDHEKLMLEKDRKNRLNSFISDVNVIQVNKEFNIHQTLNLLCEQEQADREVLEECRKQLQIAEEQLKKEE